MARPACAHSHNRAQAGTDSHAQSSSTMFGLWQRPPGVEAAPPDVRRLRDEEMDPRTQEAPARFLAVPPSLPNRPRGERTALITSLDGRHVRLFAPDETNSHGDNACVHQAPGSATEPPPVHHHFLRRSAVPVARTHVCEPPTGRPGSCGGLPRRGPVTHHNGADRPSSREKDDATRRLRRTAPARMDPGFAKCAAPPRATLRGA